MLLKNTFRNGLQCSKYLVLVSCCLLLANSISSAQTYDQLVSAYINQYKDIAIEEMHRVGIPASITLAQGIIESRAGQSPLATDANNHFGIKCHEDWHGNTFLYDDDAKQECFRKYSSALESFQDHSDFLKSHARYATLFQINPNNYKEWAKGLKACGYATNPHYAQVLIKTIEDYDLHQWDLSGEERSEWLAANAKDSLQQNTSAPKRINPVAAPITTENADERIYTFNNIKCITLQEGETLNDIATAFQIGLPRLKRYNDLTENNQLFAGDRVYLQPKRHNGDVKLYVVQANDSMFGISRDHGIELKRLYEKNKMQPGTEPAEGEKLYLRSDRKTPPKLRSPKGTLDSVLTSKKIESQEDFSVNDSNPKVYTVSKGDTLYSISRKYDLSVDTLKRINGLESNSIYVGQKLKVSE